MGPKEKYNIIVNKIEELVQGECIDGIIMGMDELEICEKAFDAAQSIMDIRSQNILFGFLMDKRIKTYVQERKMMAAYKYMINSEERYNKTIGNMIELSGFQDEKAFSKKFKEYFNITPKKAYEKKDKSLLIDIKDWDMISLGTEGGVVELEEDSVSETKFGISRDKYANVLVAANLQSFYSLNDYESELAFELSEKNGFSLKDTFKYIYSYLQNYVDVESEERDNYIVDDLLNENVIYMYFQCKMNFNDIISVLLAMRKHSLPRVIEETDKFYLLGFVTYCECYDDIRILYSYDELYTYYFQKVKKFEAEETEFIIYIYNAGRYGKTEALYMSFNKDESEDVNIDQDALWKDEEEYCVMHMEEYDYEPDFDDIEMEENLWLDHDYYERARELLEEEQYYSESIVEDFYDEEDDEEDKEILERKTVIGKGFDLEGREKRLEKLRKDMGCDDDGVNDLIFK